MKVPQHALHAPLIISWSLLEVRLTAVLANSSISDVQFVLATLLARHVKEASYWKIADASDVLKK